MEPARTPSEHFCEVASSGEYDFNSAAAVRVLRSVSLVDASPSGRVCFATERATFLLSKYLQNPRQPPSSLVRCISEHCSTGNARLLPWTAELGADQLTVRLTGKLGSHAQLLLEEGRNVLTAQALRDGVSLTPREAEVLLWISKGKTSPEIAAIVGCCAATVNKHTQSIFSKLGVETRTAAAAMAIELIR